MESEAVLLTAAFLANMVYWFAGDWLPADRRVKALVMIVLMSAVYILGRVLTGDQLAEALSFVELLKGVAAMLGINLGADVLVHGGKRVQVASTRGWFASL